MQRQEAGSQEPIPSADRDLLPRHLVLPTDSGLPAPAPAVWRLPTSSLPRRPAQTAAASTSQTS